MKCRVCNRPLKHPRHVQAGMGPVCARKLGLTFMRQPRRMKPEPPKRASNFHEPMLPFDDVVPA